MYSRWKWTNSGNKHVILIIFLDFKEETLKLTSKKPQRWGHILKNSRLWLHHCIFVGSYLILPFCAPGEPCDVTKDARFCKLVSHTPVWTGNVPWKWWKSNYLYKTGRNFWMNCSNLTNDPSIPSRKVALFYRLTYYVSKGKFMNHLNTLSLCYFVFRVGYIFSSFYFNWHHSLVLILFVSHMTLIT